MLCKSINSLNKWRLLVYCLFKVIFISFLHDLITLCMYWIVILLHCKISFHLLISSLHDQHSLASVWFLLWRKIGWLWIQLIPRCWWLNPYFQHVRLTNLLWWYVGRVHWLMFINKLFPYDNLKRGFSGLLIKNFFFSWTSYNFGKSTNVSSFVIGNQCPLSKLLLLIWITSGCLYVRHCQSCYNLFLVFYSWGQLYRHLCQHDGAPIDLLSLVC